MDLMPKFLSTYLEESVDKSVALAIKQEADIVQLASKVKFSRPAPNFIEKTELGLDISSPRASLGKLGEYKPDDISSEQIEAMRKNGMVKFAMGVIKSPVMGIARSNPGEEWSMECDSERLKKLATRNFKSIRMSLVPHQLTSLDYGFAVGEKVWKYESGSKFGSDNKKYVSLKQIKPNHPNTIEILRLEENDKATGRFRGDFDGYLQKLPTSRDTVHVKYNDAFIQTHDKGNVFGNLYGSSVLVSVFPFWYWYEVVTRALLRYLERRGTPVVVVYAPSSGTLYNSEDTEIATMDYALQIAMDIARTTADALPSDVDPETKQPLWRVEYLLDDQRADQFMEVIKWLGEKILESIGVPVRVVSEQSGGSAAYTAYQTNLDVFLQTVEDILDEVVRHINSYILPDLARYNFGQNAPEVNLRTTGIDRSKFKRFIELIDRMVAAGIDVGVDGREMAKSLGIPVLPEGESMLPPVPVAASPSAPTAGHAPGTGKGVKQGPVSQRKGPPKKNTTKMSMEMDTEELIRFIEMREKEGKPIPFSIEDVERMEDARV